MSDEETDSWRVISLLIFLILITATIVAGNSLSADRDVLLNLKSFLEERNRVNQGRYANWNQNSSNPCEWEGISCNGGQRVVGVRLSDEDISGELFGNFSALTELSYLDLSSNTIGGAIPDDLGRCRNLVHLNLSHNIIEGVINLSGLSNLQTLDLSVNRIFGEVELTFPAICSNLIVANISANNFSGRIDSCFDECMNLQYLDLGSNNFNGGLWKGFVRLKEFSVSENSIDGELSHELFMENCSLQVLDLSDNGFFGQVPKEISNCKNLVILNLWGNNFTGLIPSEIGSIHGLEILFLGNNSFSRNVPYSLLNLSRLEFLDLSRNGFGGDVQEIFGKFAQLNYLVLHSNSYTGGIHSSGILELQNVLRLDLSHNNFSGPLPVEISRMPNLKFLILAYNQFSGSIPSEYGDSPRMQALDLSFNRLNGSIPPSFGKLNSLLWLMLANNSLTGEIPPELGNCRSLLWLNLANNQLSGNIPSELMNIGRNATPTFEMNRQSKEVIPGSGECLAMRRWIPVDYPPFNFVYTILTRKSCRSIWDQLLKGIGLFPVCVAGSKVRSFQISGYLQLSTNLLSGELPSEIGKMQNFSMLSLGYNRLSGKLPPEVEHMPLVVLNITQNKFSGEIPSEIGRIKCLNNLDLSYNNFSGMFPNSISNLTELTKFDISYNPLITGVVPSTGQLATFEKESYLGNPLLKLPSFINSTRASPPGVTSDKRTTRPRLLGVILAVIALIFTFLVFGFLSVVACKLVKSPEAGCLLDNVKYRHDFGSSSCSLSPWLSDTIKIINLDKAAFSHSDILKATNYFSEDRIIGKGGYGIVYRGVLPDGREVAVKKLQREGTEGEREFLAEMECLCGNGLGWPHPNLVTLYGWCLDGSNKILVYEYMEGGSLEELVSDRMRLTWQRRIEVAVDVAHALMFLHHECDPAIVHRDVKASNVLLDKDGTAHVTDFGLARIVDAGNSHVSTVVAGTVGYVAPEYGLTWQATTKGDVYSFGVLTMELATGRRAVDGGEECLVEWVRRVMGNAQHASNKEVIHSMLLGSELAEGTEEMCELLRVGIKCTAEAPQARPNMKEVLAMLIKISSSFGVIQSLNIGIEDKVNNSIGYI